MDFQTAFNVALGGGSLLAGWILNTVWNAIKDMQATDKQLADKVSAIEVLVAGNYIPRAEYAGDMSAIRDSLKRIEDKIDSKADK